jgi:hypothetical protein
VNQFGLVFHHFGLAVADPEMAFRCLDGMGYRAGVAVFDPLQNVNVAMRHHAQMPDVEVIWPGDGPSPIDRLIKGSGSMIYHLCYSTRDAAASLSEMEKAGLDILTASEATPAVLFQGLPVSFHMVMQFGLIELIHGFPNDGEPVSTS